VLKDVFGRGAEEMELTEGASVADLIAACRGRYAGAAEVWDSIAVAVNQEYARAVDVLKDEDEVALLPPVSGGLDFDRARAIGETKGDTADLLRG
jgi:molybdopterin converting factor small subunit